MVFVQYFSFQVTLYCFIRFSLLTFEACTYLCHCKSVLINFDHVFLHIIKCKSVLIAQFPSCLSAYKTNLVVGLILGFLCPIMSLHLLNIALHIHNAIHFCTLSLLYNCLISFRMFNPLLLFNYHQLHSLHYSKLAIPSVNYIEMCGNCRI